MQSLLVREVLAGWRTTPGVLTVNPAARLDKLLLAERAENMEEAPPVPEVMEVPEVQRVHLTCRMPTMAEVTAETASRMEDADKAPLHANLESLPAIFMLAAVALFVSITIPRDMVVAVPVEEHPAVDSAQSQQQLPIPAAAAAPYTKIAPQKQEVAVVPVS